MDLVRYILAILLFMGACGSAQHSSATFTGALVDAVAELDEALGTLDILSTEVASILGQRDVEPEAYDGVADLIRRKLIEGTETASLLSQHYAHLIQTVEARARRTTTFYPARYVVDDRAWSDCRTRSEAAARLAPAVATLRSLEEERDRAMQDLLRLQAVERRSQDVLAAAEQAFSKGMSFDLSGTLLNEWFALATETTAVLDELEAVLDHHVDSFAASLDEVRSTRERMERRLAATDEPCRLSGEWIGTCREMAGELVTEFRLELGRQQGRVVLVGSDRERLVQHQGRHVRIRVPDVSLAIASAELTPTQIGITFGNGGSGRFLGRFFEGFTRIMGYGGDQANAMAFFCDLRGTPGAP